MIAYDFRSPPWGPVWRAPSDQHIRIRIRPLLDAISGPANMSIAIDNRFAEMIDGDAVAVWPAVARWILGLPHPLRPWRLDPARRGWYAATLAEFLAQCLAAAAAHGGPLDPRMADGLRRLSPPGARDCDPESVIADLEAAYASQAPPRQPPRDDASTCDWPVWTLHAARRRAAIALTSTSNLMAVNIRMNDGLATSMWSAVAVLFLGIPCPIGAWRLRPSHLIHCHEVLRRLTDCTNFFVIARDKPRTNEIRERVAAIDPATQLDAVLALLRALEAESAAAVIVET